MLVGSSSLVQSCIIVSVILLDDGLRMAIQVELTVIMTSFRCLINVFRFKYVWIMCWFGFALGCNWFNHGVHRVITGVTCELQLVYRKPGFLRVNSLYSSSFPETAFVSDGGSLFVDY